MVQPFGTTTFASGQGKGDLKRTSRIVELNAYLNLTQKT